MFRCGRGVFACAVALAGLSAPSLASAEIARPPGANPSDRGFELVSLPDSGGQPMSTGTNVTRLTAQRPPAVPRSGGLAFVSTYLPVDGQPDSAGLSVFRATRQASGTWTHTFAGLPQRRQQFDDSGQVVGWSTDLTTTLWLTGGPVVDPTDPTSATSYRAPQSLLRQPLGATPRDQLNVTGYSVAQTANNTGPDDSSDLFPRLSSDGRTVTFTKAKTAFAANTPLSSVYQRTADGPAKLVSIAPGNAPVQNAALDAVSPDGSRVAFSSDDGTSGAPKPLYLRDGTQSFAVDAPQQPVAAPRTTTQFVGASSDLSTIFFVTRDRLLAADTDDDADVYRWTEAATNHLSLVSAGPGTVGNGTGADCPAALPTTQVSSSPQGCDTAFVASSADGNTTYFLSPEQLNGAAGAQPGAPNLYVRRGQNPVKYLLTLDGSDQLVQQRKSPQETYSYERTFNLEDDGTLLVRTLRNPATGTAYDATQIVRVAPGTDDLSCVSCTTGGGSASEAQLATPFDGYTEPPVKNATADGRHIFFDTPARLVPEDRNSLTDVYDLDVATGARTLVSSATGGTPSYFTGVSASGDDVMIGTTATLVAKDQNGPFNKVYDARRSGGETAPVTVPPVACDDDACKPPAAAPPAFGDPASSLLGTSRGNVTAAPAVRLAVGTVSAAQRRALVRTGTLKLSVRTSRAATVRVRGRAKLGRSTSTVASGSVRLKKAGTGRVTLRLSAAARRALKSKGALKVSFTASVAGSSSKKVSVSLRAATDKKAGAR